MGNWLGRDRTEEGPPAAHKVKSFLLCCSAGCSRPTLLFTGRDTYRVGSMQRCCGNSKPLCNE